MSFFKKMKERLFKSSSKLDQGLEAIVDEGDEVVEQIAPTAADVVSPEPSDLMAPEIRPEPAVEAPAADPPAASPELEPKPKPKPVERPPQPAQPVAPQPMAPTPQAEPPRAERSIDQSEAPAFEPEEPPRAAPPIDLPEMREPVSPPQPPAPEKVPETVSPPVEEVKPSVAPAPPVTPTPAAQTAKPVETAEPAAARPGMMARALGALTGTQKVKKRVLDDAMLEELEELLITADMGVDTALKVSARLAEGRFGRALSTDEIKRALSTELAKILEPIARPLPLYAKRPQVVLVVGVNGSGKTTTIGKLASQLKGAGKRVVIAAGDTFRAAAVEQLQVWGERAGVPVMTASQGSDPASLAFEAMQKAEAEGADILLVDTAGRLQNRADLMEELAKIVRVIRKKDPEAPHNTVLVLDATTGQNALSQVDIFRKIADVSGLVMTKLDGTAKGGVLVALADRFGLPIHAIGVGEAIDDLAPFDPDEFADALTGRG